MSRTIPRAARGSFTLVELLVVVAIIAVLAAFLLPSLRSAMERGRATVCQGKLRQIGSAIDLYAADNDGLIVPNRTQPGSASYYWVGLLAPYFGVSNAYSGFAGNQNATPYMCPSAKTNSTGLTYYSLPLSATAGYRTRYDINPHITTAYAADLAASQTYRAGRMSQMRLSKTFIVMDCFGSGGAGYWVVSSGRLSYPHPGGMNVLYLDGHVEPKTRAQMQYYASLPYHVFWRGYDWGYPGYTEN